MTPRKTPAKPPRKPKVPLTVLGAVRTDDTLSSLVAMRDVLASVMDAIPEQAAAASSKLLVVMNKIADLQKPAERSGLDELEQRRRDAGRRVPEAKPSGSSVRESRRVRGG